MAIFDNFDIEKYYLELNEKYGSMGASCVIVRDGKIANELTYGYSSREKETKANIDTVYRIASVSKLVVATATMTLVEKGMIDLDEDISKYLGFEVRNPRYPDKIIDLKMIMTQTSSITDGYEEGVNSNYDSGYNKIICEDEITPLYEFLNPNGKRWVSETFSEYEPGTHYEYANLGCGIQACIIEKVTGIKFTKYVRDNVLLPLGLDASFDVRDIVNPDVATLYVNRGGKLFITRTKEDFVERYIKDRGLGNNYVGPAGGLFISAKHLAKLMMMFMNGGELDGVRILKKETMDRMLEITWIGVGDGDYTAKGLQFKCMDFETNDISPRRLYGHFGDAYGVKSFLLFNPSQKLGFVYIINGGLFHYQVGKPCDLHEEFIDKLCDEYWNYDLNHHFEFVVGEKTGKLDGRIINLHYVKEVTNKATKKVILSPMTMIDCFTIPTLINKTKVINEVKESLKDLSVYDFVQNDKGLYFYDYKFEELDNGGLKFIVDYKPKKATPRL
ncbi:MAG: beta-lactamase family protein [Bacilli bacterium]|nr:beta-lactamase family protein [Bacilli bacterium]